MLNKGMFTEKKTWDHKVLHLKTGRCLMKVPSNINLAVFTEGLIGRLRSKFRYVQ